MNRRNFLSTILSSIGAFVLAPVIKVLEPVARTMYDPSLIMKAEVGTFMGMRIILSGKAPGKTAGYTVTNFADGGWLSIAPDPMHELKYGEFEQTYTDKEETDVPRLVS